MQVFVTGASGVMGRSVVVALLGAGHDVRALARSGEQAGRLQDDGVEPVVGGLFDPDGLVVAFSGCDVVCNLASHVPAGFAAVRPGAWRVGDRIRGEGSRVVAQAARAAGVRRFVQESASLLYADGGDQWLTEDSPIAVNRATEPLAMAETHAQEFTDGTRHHVVLRFGSIVGDDDYTRWRLARARSGQPVAYGAPDGWMHVINAEDVGTAVLAALTAPAGTYNVGAEPVRRRDLAQLLTHAVGRDRSRFLTRPLLRLGGERVEMLTRSHRVSSRAFCRATGWKPRHGELSTEWVLPGRSGQRRRRLAALGDAYASRSADDSDEGWSEGGWSDGNDRDDDLRREVPPHH
ncbi:MAG: NAD(P)-dependent oxidoreductase [Nocardioidaceae bacterium]|nr:NAD(P)-dependent oxidoreductase [Nocardioidaceae bacterium]